MRIGDLGELIEPGDRGAHGARRRRPPAQQVDDRLPADDVAGQVDVGQREADQPRRVHQAVDVGDVQRALGTFQPPGHGRLGHVAVDALGRHLVDLAVHHLGEVDVRPVAQRMMRQHRVVSGGARVEDVAEVDVDAEQHAADVGCRFDVDLRVSGHLCTAGQLRAPLQDVAQLHEAQDAGAGSTPGR